MKHYVDMLATFVAKAVQRQVCLHHTLELCTNAAVAALHAISGASWQRCCVASIQQQSVQQSCMAKEPCVSTCVSCRKHVWLN